MLTPKERRLLLGVAVVPLAVFIIAMSARIIYLQVGSAARLLLGCMHTWVSVVLLSPALPSGCCLVMLLDWRASMYPWVAFFIWTLKCCPAEILSRAGSGRRGTSTVTRRRWAAHTTPAWPFVALDGRCTICGVHTTVPYATLKDRGPYDRHTAIAEACC